LAVTARDAAGNAGTATLTVNYLLPTITSISPTSVSAGGSAFAIVVAGTNFVDSSVVQVNGAPRTTVYGSPTLLAATVLASDVAQPGTVQVTVVTPPSSGTTSNTASLTINPISATSGMTTGDSTTTASTTSSGSTTTLGSTTSSIGGSTTGGSTTSSSAMGSSTATTGTSSTATSSTWAAGQSYVDPSSSMTVARVTDSATAPGGATGNSSASDSMFNVDGTLFYLHHQNVGTFLYAADR